MARSFVVFIYFLFGGLLSDSSQEPASATESSVVRGEVVSIAADRITLSTSIGQVVVSIDQKTEIRRVAPAKQVLKTAVTATVADISVGDKVLFKGNFSTERGVFLARFAYQFTKSDIEEKERGERELWVTRGISGRVKGVDLAKNQVRISVRGVSTFTEVVVAPKPQAAIKRYLSNSINFSDARISKFADLKAGDMLRALGEWSADGRHFAAEAIVSGSFRTVTGLVTSVDATKGEIVIDDNRTHKYVVIFIGKDSMLKKFPNAWVQRWVVYAGHRGSDGVNPLWQVQTPEPKVGQTIPDIDSVFERFPAIGLREISIGDTIAVSSTRDGPADRVIAIKLLAGIEPFLRPLSNKEGASRIGSGVFLPGFDDIEVP